MRSRRHNHLTAAFGGHMIMTENRPWTILKFYPEIRLMRVIKAMKI
jgi:hypothetical protein